MLAKKKSLHLHLIHSRDSREVAQPLPAIRKDGGESKHACTHHHLNGAFAAQDAIYNREECVFGTEFFMRGFVQIRNTLYVIYLHTVLRSQYWQDNPLP